MVECILQDDLVPTIGLVGIYVYTCTYIETDIKEPFVQTPIACKLVIGGKS